MGEASVLHRPKPIIPCSKQQRPVFRLQDIGERDWHARMGRRREMGGGRSIGREVVEAIVLYSHPQVAILSL